MLNRMYKKGLYTIVENRPLTAAVWRMVLAGDTQYIVRPGQFIDIAIDGLFLRRPISVCDWDDSTVTIIYKVVGKGTEAMSHMAPGSVLDCLTGLGNGFATDNGSQSPLLVGGGVGVPPLYNLCKRLTAEGRRPTVVMGFSTAGEIFYREEFEKLGVHRCRGRGVRLHICLRSRADAQGSVRSLRRAGAVQLRGAHGLRLRRLHGVQLQNQVRQQTHLRRRTGA